MIGTDTNPSSLFAIAFAAHRTGNRSLEQSARRLLAEHGVTVRFSRPPAQVVRLVEGGGRNHVK